MKQQWLRGITIKRHSASFQLSGLYLTKVIILSHFLCIRSRRNGGRARHSTLTSHMICVASSHHPRLKINLSCQQHDGPSAPDLYSERSVCRPEHMQGDQSPCRRHAVTDPPRCQNMETCQSREKHQLLTDNVPRVTTHPGSPE